MTPGAIVRRLLEDEDDDMGVKGFIPPTCRVAPKPSGRGVWTVYDHDEREVGEVAAVGKDWTIYYVEDFITRYLTPEDKNECYSLRFPTKEAAAGHIAVLRTRADQAHANQNPNAGLDSRDLGESDEDDFSVKDFTQDPFTYTWRSVKDGWDYYFPFKRFESSTLASHTFWKCIFVERIGQSSKWRMSVSDVPETFLADMDPSDEPPVNWADLALFMQKHVPEYFGIQESEDEDMSVKDVIRLPFNRWLTTVIENRRYWIRRAAKQPDNTDPKRAFSAQDGYALYNVYRDYGVAHPGRQNDIVALRKMKDSFMDEDAVRRFYRIPNDEVGYKFLKAIKEI